jgi:hypothetical protein
MPKKKGKRDHKVSSGLRAKRKAKRTINRLVMKMSRWERYKKEISEGRRSGSPSRWDTSGIEKHIAFLEKTYK